MLKDAFIGRIPTHFKVNPLVKAFIISEMLLWSAYNLFNPILAVFVVNKVSGGKVEYAAFGFSFYLITRVIVEIISGRAISKQTENKRFMFIIGGLLILSFSYLLFSVSSTLIYLFISFICLGIGLGVSAPARMSVFSNHLDKNKEPEEWSIVDATSLMGMALAGALGGLIADQYGFSILFLIASLTNFLSIFPYISFMKKR